MKYLASCKACGTRIVVEAAPGENVKVAMTHPPGCEYTSAVQAGKELAWVKQYGSPLVVEEATPPVMLHPLQVDCVGLEAKWRKDSPDQPPCALCAKQIGGDAGAAEADPDVPVRVVDGRDLEVAFHAACLLTSGRWRP